MCELCDESPDGMESCQDCGTRICFDIEQFDDFQAPAYVTSSGDLFCVRCGSQHDAAEEREIEEEWGGYGGEF